MEQVGIDLRVQGRHAAQQDLQAVSRDLDALDGDLRDLSGDADRTAREFDAALRDFAEASRAMETRVGADLDGVGRDLRGLGDDADRARREVNQAFDDMGRGVELDGEGGMLARMGLSAGAWAGAGAAAAAAFIAAAHEGVQRDATDDLRAAAAGAFAPDVRAEFDQAIDQVYEGGWGDGYDDATRGVALARQVTFGMNLDMVEVQQVAEAGLALASIYDTDVAEVLRGASNLAKTTGTLPAAGFDHVTEIGVARLAREGTDVTVVTWGAALLQVTEIAAALAERGIEVEIIDPRWLDRASFDRETVLESVGRTGALIIAEDAQRTLSMGNQILDYLYPDLHALLRTAPLRVTAQDAYSPVSKPLEAFVNIQDADIEAAIVAAASSKETS